MRYYSIVTLSAKPLLTLSLSVDAMRIFADKIFMFTVGFQVCFLSLNRKLCHLQKLRHFYFGTTNVLLVVAIDLIIEVY